MSRAARSRVDLLVVGGGPAGSAMAIFAARAGLRVTLVEKQPFPRRKVCGEFISAEGCLVLSRLGLLKRIVRAGAASIGRTKLTHPSGRWLDLDLPHLSGIGREAIGFSREKLDPMLLDLAREEGVETLQPWQACGIDSAGGRVRGLTVRRVGDGRTRAIVARVIVAADGRRSMLARRLHGRGGDPTATRSASRFGFAAQFSDRSQASRLIGLHIFDGGYAGLGPIEGGRQNLAWVASVSALRACGGRPERLLEERLKGNPAIAKALDGESRCSSWTSIGPLSFGRRRPAAAGVLFIGDAAGTVDPFCGEGISNALCGAQLALPFVEQAVSRGGVDGALGRRYSRAWRAAFARPARRAAHVAKLLERPRLALPVMGLLEGGLAQGLSRRLIAATRTGWAGS